MCCLMCIMFCDLIWLWGCRCFRVFLSVRVVWRWFGWVVGVFFDCGWLGIVEVWWGCRNKGCCDFEWVLILDGCWRNRLWNSCWRVGWWVWGFWWMEILLECCLLGVCWNWDDGCLWLLERLWIVLFCCFGVLCMMWCVCLFGLVFIVEFRGYWMLWVCCCVFLIVLLWLWCVWLCWVVFLVV